MKQNLSFLIVDDHLVIRRGLSYLLKDRYPSSKIEEADQSKTVLDKVKNYTYDLIIQDLFLPDFEPLSFINTLLTFRPEQKILVYSMSPEELFAKRVLNLGAKGYLEKKAPESTLYLAVDTVLNGGRYVSQKMTHQLLNAALDNKPNNLFDTLSDREMEVLLLLLKGRTSQEITQILSVQPSTVGTYKSRLFNKLNVSNVVDLIQVARSYGL